jgi:D-arabinose 5-phosphate isomerase GutQ
MPVGGTRLERMRATLLREAAILEELGRTLDPGAAAAVDLLLETQGHVLVGGAGTSNAVAKRFAHLLSCSGQPALFVHPADSLHGSSGAVTADDTVILISKGGKTAEVNRFAAIVKSRGARLIAFTEAPESELGRLADAVVRVKIPADSDPFGMVATSSSLANAAVADAICETILMERGYTKEAFAGTHPGGAVGERIKTEGILS